jgi:MFS family permease
MSIAHTDIAARRAPHPFVYTILIVPFGATAGFVGVTLAFLATHVGLEVTDGAALVAWSNFPNVWKFFWSPVGDKTLTRKRWYLLSCVLCAIGTFAMATLPLSASTMSAMTVIVVVTSVAATFLGFAVEGLIAALTPANERGNVSGWYQAGNLGGNGIGGGLGLLLLNALPAPWMAGTILGALTLACAIPLAFVDEVPHAHEEGSVSGAMIAIGRDVWRMITSREGALGALLCFLPVATGAAASVLAQAEVAAHWGAGEHEVELSQGLLTGFVSMIGCLAGGALCQRINARAAYAVFGSLMAGVTAAMALLPPTPTTYVGCTLVYAFVTGLSYAAFSALVFDAIGHEGHAATKYNGFASLSNAPIWYVGWMLGQVASAAGPNAMLYVESGLGVVGIVIFAIASYLLPEKKAA